MSTNTLFGNAGASAVSAAAASAPALVSPSTACAVRLRHAVPAFAMSFVAMPSIAGPWSRGPVSITTAIDAQAAKHVVAVGSSRGTPV